MSLPKSMRLLTQKIVVTTEPDLHARFEDTSPKSETDRDGDGEPHIHACYGVYSEAEQSITLDAGLHFERQRETLLHESLHAMLAVGQLDALMAGSMEGFDEHLVSALAPILLSWMRDNPDVVVYLIECQA